MKTKQEIKKWLLENCLNDNGDLVICDIDLSDFKGNVILNSWTVGKSAGLSFWEVKGNLHQSYQTVNGNLEQSSQNVDGDLKQGCQKVNGNLFQDYQTAENIYQGWQNVSKDLTQGFQTAEDLYQECQNVSKDLVSQKLKEDEEWVDLQGSNHAVIRAKKLKEISKDELAELGYKLKEKN